MVSCAAAVVRPAARTSAASVVLLAYCLMSVPPLCERRQPILAYLTKCVREQASHDASTAFEPRAPPFHRASRGLPRLFSLWNDSTGNGCLGSRYFPRRPGRWWESPMRLFRLEPRNDLARNRLDLLH